MSKRVYVVIQWVYEQLRELLGEYVETKCFNQAPKGAPEQDGLGYTTRRMKEIRRYAAALLEAEPEAAYKQEQILLETEFFLRRYEQPGVVPRWKELNPNLIFFECAFELMENDPELYEKFRRGLVPFYLECYPDEKMMAQRKDYFKAAQERFALEGREYDKDLVFQEELCRTLELVFQADFGEDWCAAKGRSCV